MNGTHILAHVSREPALPGGTARAGSPELTRGLRFRYAVRFVLPGWEDSAHDMPVLGDATGEPGLKPPPGKYFLGDAGYTNGDWILTPFRGVKYPLREQWQSFAEVKYCLIIPLSE